LARQPDVGSLDAWVWLFGSGLLSGLLVSFGPALLGIGPVSDQNLALGIPVFALLAVFSCAIFAVCIQGVARLFKGGGACHTLIYVFAAFHAPLMLLASVLPLVPHHRPVLIALYLYWLMLYSVAVQAAHQFSLLKAVGAILLSLVIVSGGFLGLLLLVISLRF
jgi:hypothetical protein